MSQCEKDKRKSLRDPSEAAAEDISFLSFHSLSARFPCFTQRPPQPHTRLTTQTTYTRPPSSNTPTHHQPNPTTNTTQTIVNRRHTRSSSAAASPSIPTDEQPTYYRRELQQPIVALPNHKYPATSPAGSRSRRLIVNPSFAVPSFLACNILLLHQTTLQPTIVSLQLQPRNITP